MTRRSAWLSGLAPLGFALLGFAAGPASALTVYDPGLGSLPSAQGWSTAGVGPFAESLAGGTYALDTTATNAISAGSALQAPSLLDTAAGFTLDFGLQIVLESHAADDERAGFSLIVIGADPRQSIEFGFRQDEVFAYTAGFVPGAAASFSTLATTAYSLVVAADRYSLFGNGSLLLGGALVDYSARGLPPYTTSGVIFLGDDTSRARSASRLGTVTLDVAAVPEPQIAASLALGLAALALSRRRAAAAAGRARRWRRR